MRRVELFNVMRIVRKPDLIQRSHSIATTKNRSKS